MQISFRLPFITMTTVIVRVDVMSTREREVIDLTAPSREPSVDPMLASSSTLVGVEKYGGRELSKTLSPSREATPGRDNRQAEMYPELPGASATPKGKEVRRSPSPVEESRSSTEIEVGRPYREVPATAETSSSTTVTELPTTPKSNRKASAALSNNDGNGNGSLSPRKHRLDTPEPLVIAKKEPRDYNNSPPSPIEAYPTIVKLEDDEDDDALVFSPKKPKGSPDIDLTAIPFHRSFTPSPLPSAAPVYHPDFPERPALRCPKRNRDHLVIECKPSESSRNMNRLYFKCRDCPNYGSFICWADARLTWASGRNGRHPHQAQWPRCHCGEPAREDITGDNAQYPDTLWYKCATDACRFRRYDKNDRLSYEEVNMYAGWQVY
ncbi:hypothetical protein F5Y06DRAFT_260574 [Hypoxylon sp. FL0890]|nr:hypothetical protein F5Y06DRAFT_260574 [Hypoxylon sp. FL0890]